MELEQPNFPELVMANIAYEAVWFRSDSKWVLRCECRVMEMAGSVLDNYIFESWCKVLNLD